MVGMPLLTCISLWNYWRLTTHVMQAISRWYSANLKLSPLIYSHPWPMATVTVHIDAYVVHDNDGYKSNEYYHSTSPNSRLAMAW
jgi:hypothetical protein